MYGLPRYQFSLVATSLHTCLAIGIATPPQRGKVKTTATETTRDDGRAILEYDVRYVACYEPYIHV